MTIKTLPLLAAALLGLASAAPAADVLNAGTNVPFLLTSTIYGQNFDSLKATSQDTIPATALPAGWQTFESGDRGNDSYQFGTSGSNISGVWSYGLTSERALGGLTNPSIPLLRVGAVFANGLGGTINSLAIGYTGEQWQNGFNRATLRFEYSLNATSIVDGTWTSLSSLDFVAPNTAAHQGSQFGIMQVNGNNAAFRTSLADVIGGLSIAPGASFGLRWSLADIDTPGVTTDDGLGIDDFTLTATVAAVPEPASWAMMVGGFGLIGGALRRQRRAPRPLTA